MAIDDRRSTISRRDLLRGLGRVAAAAGLAALAVLLARRSGRAGTAPPCAERGGCAGCPAAGRCPKVETPR